jgi:hypothetical protein
VPTVCWPLQPKTPIACSSAGRLAVPTVIRES